MANLKRLSLSLSPLLGFFFLLLLSVIPLPLRRLAASSSSAASSHFHLLLPSPIQKEGSSSRSDKKVPAASAGRVRSDCQAAADATVAAEAEETGKK